MSAVRLHPLRILLVWAGVIAVVMLVAKGLAALFSIPDRSVFWGFAGSFTVFCLWLIYRRASRGGFQWLVWHGKDKNDI